MKNSVKLLMLGFVSIGSTMFLQSCSDDDGPATSNGTASMRIMLTDAPAAYDEVNIDVQGLEINRGNGLEPIDILHPGIYNLLDFRNGVDTLIADEDLPAGSISQIRLILGPNNTIVVDGVQHPLETPSAMQSGLKINVNQTLLANRAYTMWLDFDAGRSILQTGNGTFKLKPVMRAFTELTNGRIEGTVLPAAANATVYAYNVLDTFAAIPNNDGFFMISGLPADTYSLLIDADSTTMYRDTTITGLNVSFGNVNNVGTITVPQ